MFRREGFQDRLLKKWEEKRWLGLLPGYFLPAGPIVVSPAKISEIWVVTTNTPQSFFAAFLQAVFHEKVGRPHVLWTLNFPLDPS
jgi:hypothetical protein